MSAYERSGWRDEEISRRHRAWGVNCPSCDLDFLMVEYNLGKPCGLVEYKHHNARTVDLNHATYRAICSLANVASLPFAIAFYWPETWCFYVYPVNALAMEIYVSERWQKLSEQEFVRSLYRMRKRVIDRHILDHLSAVPFPANEQTPTVTAPREAA